MRLRKIRLAGFKSFVDPTTLIVPGNLVGVVGPNGCGKSNIIDAVTWVMGESSAKHLRGDSLTDVIFNGSSMRQPVGQASVELVFDNSENRIGGAYASYNEISIKRQIARDGISTYFLNGTRCRRKDIQSLFLGTGLGPRSYAIIEQGVVSRLIEAKPEELRAFIEEAAGISKYRERRRETEHRMRHTRDNLDRLNDIREELARQLAHLQRQARSAERYQILKQEERRHKAELLGLQWRDLRIQADGKAVVLREHENRVEGGIANLRAVEAEITRQREECSAANEEHSRAQSRFYEAGGAISRLEQMIQNSEERILGVQQDLAATRTGRETAESQLQQDRARLSELENSSSKLEPQLHGSRTGSTEAYAALAEAERAIRNGQAEWDAFNEMAADVSRRLEIDCARSKFLAESLEEIKQRRTQLTRELQAAGDAEHENEMNRLGRELAGLDKSTADSRADLEKKQTELRACRAALADAADRLTAVREEQHATHAELVSIETLLRAQMPDDSDTLQTWLRAAGLGDVPRLVDSLKVDPEWSLALETVLGHRLQDLCVPELEGLTRSLHKLKSGRVGAVASAGVERPEKGRRPSLIDKLAPGSPLHPHLRGVLIADSVTAAVGMKNELRSGESVVTRDGLWIGRDWAVINRPAENSGGLLSRETRIRDLRVRTKDLERQAEAQDKLLATLRVGLIAAEEAVETAQEKLNTLVGTQSSVIGRHAEIRTRLEELGRRCGQVRLELDEVKQSEQSDLKELGTLRDRVSTTGARQEKLAKQREQLLSLRERHRGALDEARARWQSTHEQSHELA
ncbi:MAG: chromosome segregation protein SMC, partial [Gammaproteobacteria bacterium]